MSRKLEQGLGIGLVTYNAVDADTYRGRGSPGADEMGNMFQVDRDFANAMLSHRSLDETRTLNPQLQSFDQWLANNRDAVLTATQAITT